MSTSKYIKSSISNLQATPLKKRIMKIESIYADKIVKNNITENTVIDQDITNNTQETNIQFSPTKENKTDEKDLTTKTISDIPMNMENKETKHNDNVQNNLRSPSTSPMKVNNMHSTPKKANDVLHNFDDANCNSKTGDNSVSDKNIFSLSLRELQDLLKSPPSKKTEKLLQSDNIVATNGNLEKTNNKNDDKQFCDTMESELYNSESFNVFEAVDFLHDDLLSTALNVEDTKASNMLLSSISDINTLQYIDESLADLKEDPLTDPLLISDREENDIDIAFTNSDSKSLPRRSDRLHKRVTRNYSDIKKHKLNTEEKHILRELENIQEEELPLSAIQVSQCSKYFI